MKTLWEKENFCQIETFLILHYVTTTIFCQTITKIIYWGTGDTDNDVNVSHGTGADNEGDIKNVSKFP